MIQNTFDHSLVIHLRVWPPFLRRPRSLCVLCNHLLIFVVCVFAGVQEAKEDAEKTPLQCKLDEFGDTLTWIIGVICVAVSTQQNSSSAGAAKQ